MQKQPWIRTLQPLRPVPRKEQLPSLDIHHLFQIFSFSFQSLEEASSLAEHITSFYPLAYQNLIALGINELFLNAIEHGNLGIDYEFKTRLKASNAWEVEIAKRLKEPHNQYKSVHVCMEINPEYIMLRISDQGDGFNWREYDTSNPQNTKRHGRGLIMAQEICFDKLEFSEKGNEVSCLTYLDTKSQNNYR